MSAVYKTEFRAWSCQFSLELIEPKCEPKCMVAKIKDTLNLYEQTFSRFKRDSSLSRLNQGETITTNELFAEVLRLATTLSQKLPPKYFNPHINLEAHGYHQSFENQDFKNTQNLDKPPLPFPNGLELVANTLKLKPKTNIDFGAFLKGYVAQIIADQYQDCCRGIIVNFGGDLSVRGKDIHTSAFRIGIFNPITHQDEVVILKNQSLSTSGTYKRTWNIKGDQKHHILDPSTNKNPESEFVSISFWGKDGALCDALATAAFMTTPDIWDQWRKKFSDVEYLAITRSGAVQSSIPLNA